jgi:hypothetical protein
MYGLALCMPSVGQPQGLPVLYEIPKTPFKVFIEQTENSGYTRGRSSHYRYTT